VKDLFAEYKAVGVDFVQIVEERTPEPTRQLDPDGNWICFCGRKDTGRRRTETGMADGNRIIGAPPNNNPHVALLI
jgi:hypothetical protein